MRPDVALIRVRGGPHVRADPNEDALVGHHRCPAVGDSTACPRANCFTERSVLTAKTELADHILIFGEQHLRTVLAQYGALWAPRTVTRPLITEFAAWTTDLAVTVRRPGSEQEDR